MAEHENGPNGVRDGAIMRERGRAAKVDSGALLTRMVEESLTEVTGPEPVDVVVATDAPSLDEAQLFIEGAVAFLESRDDREEVLERLRARLPARVVETAPARAGSAEASEEPEVGHPSEPDHA
jgi:hypothetical protein